MEIPRLTRLLELRYPQALTSLCQPLYGCALCINLERLATDVCHLNSYVFLLSIEDIRQRIVSALFKLLDVFHPEQLVLYTDSIVCPKRYINRYFFEQFEVEYETQQGIRRTAPLSEIDFAPKSVFMRDTVKMIAAKMQSMLEENVLKVFGYEEDFDFQTYMEQQEQTKPVYAYGLSHENKLEAIAFDWLVREVYEQREIFEKPILDVETEHVEFLQFGIVVEDVQLLRECIFCDILSAWLNDGNKTKQIAKLLDDKRDQTRISCQDARQYIFEHKETDRIMEDFVLLVLFSGNDWMPEIPGQAFKNGVLDEFIDIYKEKCIADFPFRHLLSEDSKAVETSFFGDFVRVLVKCEAVWAVNDVRDVVRAVNRLHSCKTERAEGLAEIVNAKTDIADMEQMTIRDEWQRVNTVYMPREISEQAFPSILRWYRSHFNEKIAELDGMPAVSRSANLAMQFSGKADILALYDHVLNLETANSPDFNRVSALLQKYELDEEAKLSVKMAREYLQAFEDLVCGVLNNNLTVSQYQYVVAPCAATLHAYCKLREAESRNSEIDGILWDYKGPVFTPMRQNTEKFYSRFPPAMMQHFMHIDVPITEENINNVIAVHCTSPFSLRNYCLQSRTAVFAQPTQSALPAIQNPCFGFQLPDCESRYSVRGYEIDTNIVDSLAAVKTLTAVKFAFTKHILENAAVSCLYSSLSGESFQIGEGMRFCVFEHFATLFKGGQQVACKLDLHLKRECGYQRQNSLLRLFTAEYGQISKEIGKFNVLYKDYQSPTLILRAQRQHGDERTTDLFCWESSSAFAPDCSALPPDARQAIEEHFSMQAEYILKDGFVFSALDVAGTLAAIWCNGMLYEKVNGKFESCSSTCQEICENSMEEFLQSRVNEYFYKHKGVVAASGIYFLLEKADSDVGVCEGLKQLTVERKDPFISAYSIFDYCFVVPVPLDLLEAQNRQKITAEFTQYNIIRSKPTVAELQSEISALRFCDVSDTNAVLRLEIPAETAPRIAAELHAKVGEFIKQSDINALIEHAEPVQQDDLLVADLSFAAEYPGHLDCPVSAGYVAEQLQLEITDDEVLKMAGTTAVICEESSTQFGLAATAYSIVDNALVCGDTLTYRGAILLIAFAKAFPDLFNALLKAKKAAALTGADLIASITQTGENEALKFGEVFPLARISENMETCKLAELLVQASIWFYSLPYHRRYCSTNRSLNGELIQFLKGKLNVITSNNPFVFNIYQKLPVVRQVELLWIVFADNIGAGIVISIDPASFVMICDGYERTVWPRMQRVWLLKKVTLPSWKSEFKDFKACNELGDTTKPIDKWLTVHFDIDY